VASDVDRQAIEALLAAKQQTKSQLAARLGISAPAVSQILAGKRRVTSTELPKMSAFLGISRDDLLRLLGVQIPPDESRVLVQGSVREDVVLLGDAGSADDSALEKVESPFPYEGTVVRVHGNEMFPRYREGDLIAFRMDGASPDSLIGKDAIVETEDGLLLLKVIQPGSEPDRYVLLSNNPVIPPLVNVRIKSVASIDWHKP
jgi:transcriptional regulator with XRE-family HTH domain